MKNKSDFLKDFVLYGGDGMSSNLYILDNNNISKLINYNTIIAIKDNDKNMVILNNSYYSRTTSKNQNMIKRLCDYYGINLLELEADKIKEY